MKASTVTATALLCVSGSIGAAFGQLQVFAEPMTNLSVEQMVHRGASTASIIQAIKAAPEVDFLIDNYETVRLTDAGASDTASDQIVEAMRIRVNPALARNPARASISTAPAPVPTTRTASGPISLKTTLAQCTGVPEALEIAHTRAMISTIPVQIYTSAVNSSSAAVSPQQRTYLNSILKRSIDAAFQPESVYSDMVSTFTSRCDQEKLDTFQSMAITSTYRAMDRLEMETLSPEFPAGLRAFAATLQHSKPPAARVALLQRLDRATGATDMAISILQAAVRATKGVQGASLTAGEIGNVRQTVSQQVLVSNLYIYRTVSNEELASYTEFLELTPVRWFNRTYLTSLTDIFERRIGLAIRQIKAEINSSKAARR